MEYVNPGELSEEHYARLGRLTNILDDHIDLHVKNYGPEVGLSDALNAVCAVLASVVVNAAKIDYDVFDKISSLLAYHINLVARDESDRGVYNFN